MWELECAGYVPRTIIRENSGRLSGSTYTIRPSLRHE